jgi:hypothetical protein
MYCFDGVLFRKAKTDDEAKEYFDKFVGKKVSQKLIHKLW